MLTPHSCYRQDVQANDYSTLDPQSPVYPFARVSARELSDTADSFALGSSMTEVPSEADTVCFMTYAPNEGRS